MPDLSHWDVAVDFTAAEAAALANGIDPAQHDRTPALVVPMIKRMKKSYLDKLSDQSVEPSPYSVLDDDAPQIYETEKPNAGQLLDSVGHRFVLGMVGWDSDGPYSSWLADESRSGFEIQKFSRKEIGRWLAAIGWKSGYSFDLTSQVSPPQQWPWGSHQTTALNHLAAAAKEFWSNYDPSDPYTAPKSQTVVNWLKDERGVSDVKAKAIASLLRPDDLPTGPRNSK